MGCKLNYSESSMLESQLNEYGYKTVKFNDGADYFIINSCSVTNNADKECRKIIRRAKRISPYSKIGFSTSSYFIQIFIDTHNIIS